MGSLRLWVEKSPVTRSSGVGVALGLLFYILPYGLEATVLLAMMMPGAYWGFSYCYQGWMEILQESTTLALLICFNLFCLKHLDEQKLYAPLTVLAHGVVDIFHHWKLHPTEKHVLQMCPKYPIMCGSLDFAFAFSMGFMILFFS